MDDDGSIHVIEALLAGMIILTAVLFMTATTAPSPAEGQSGLDLAKVSADTLRVLQQRPAETAIAPNADPSNAARPYPSRLDEIVDEVLRGDDLAANEALVRELVPAGNRFQLRIDNGVDHLVLLPTTADFTAQPRAAKAAETFIVPRWQDNALSGAPCASEPITKNGGPYAPGGKKLLGFAIVAGDTLRAPNGETTLLDGRTWEAWWNAEIAQNGQPATAVPRAALYGWWQHNGECFFIGSPDGTATTFPTYGIQLVVWPIA